MEKNNGLIDVIEELLEADMTAPKKVKNPQNKMGEDKVEEAQDKTDKAISANKLGDTAKPKADNQSDNSSEVLGSEKGAAMDAGGDKDVGQMDKGKLPSDAADNSKEVLGSEKGAAMDAGGDKDVGKIGSKEKGNPSDASPTAEPNKGPHNQAMDEDTEEMVWDWDKIDELSEEEFNELVETLDEDDLAEFKERYEAIVEEEELEEGQDTKIEKDANDEQLPDEEKESIKNMKSEAADDEDDDEDDDDDDDDDDDHEDKKKMDEASEKYDEEITEEDADHICESKYHVCAVVVEHPEWGIGKPIIGRHAEPDEDGNVAWYDIEFDHGIEEQVEVEGLNILDEMNHGKKKKAAEDKGDMDNDGKDEPDDKEYMDNKDKAIKKAMAKEEEEMEWDWEKIEGLSEEEFHNFYSNLSEEEQEEIEAHYQQVTEAEDETEVEEATGEDHAKAPSKAENEKHHPTGVTGKATDKGGNPGEGPHDQSKDANETPTKANPKGAVKEEDELDDEVTTIEETFEESLDEDFKEKAAVIFETAVNEKASKLAEEIEQKYADDLEAEINKINEKVDQYVDYVVNEWLEENQLEIKYSLRTEIAENFIREMKTVFESNFIDIPEEDVSVVDELTEAVESYKEQIEEQSKDLETANRELLEIKRKEIVDTIGEDLPQTQKIRLEKLSENVEADDIEEFRYKVEQLKEGYFDESSEQPLLSSLSEEVFGGAVIEEEDDSTVSQYAKFLSKTVTK